MQTGWTAATQSSRFFFWDTILYLHYFFHAECYYGGVLLLRYCK